MRNKTVAKKTFPVSWSMKIQKKIWLKISESIWQLKQNVSRETQKSQPTLEKTQGRLRNDEQVRGGQRMTQVDQSWFPVDHQGPEQQPVLEPVWQHSWATWEVTWMTRWWGPIKMSFPEYQRGWSVLKNNRALGDWLAGQWKEMGNYSWINSEWENYPSFLYLLLALSRAFKKEMLTLF